MASNSIRCNMSKDDITADIRMTLGADYNHQKAIVVVEGKDDITFFNGKLSDNVDIYESFSGKEGVKEIISFFSEKRVVGICDRDYTNSTSDTNLIYYDYLCLEMMLVSNFETFQSFANNFYFGSETPKDLLMRIFYGLKWLSIFRKLNAENAWKVKFNGISIAASCDDGNTSISIEKLLKRLNEINRGIISNNREYLVAVSSQCREECDINTYLNITQGHDFIEYFQKIANDSSPFSRSVSIDTLFGGLCCAFREQDFKATNLYNSLKEYYNAYNVQIVS